MGSSAAGRAWPDPMTPPIAEDPLISAPSETAAPATPPVEAPGEGRTSTPASRALRSLATVSGGPLRTLAFLAVVAALYFGKAVLVPVALAGLVAFLLSPIAKSLERLRIPRALAATVSALGLAVGLFAVLWISASQAVDLARRLPEYSKTLDAKFAFLRPGGAASPLKEASDRLKALGGQLSGGVAGGGDPGTATPPADGSAPGRPSPAEPSMPVRIVPDAPGPFDVYQDMLGPVLGPLGDAAVVVLLAIFLLTYRVDVRERLLALGSAPRLGVTSQALDEAGRGVARYLLSNLAVNALYGTTVGVGVWLIGLPNAPLWGLLSGLLRFVPYVGTWIGAALPLAVSIAVFDGWGKTIAVFATILGLDVVIGNVVEPVVYGRRTGLSPLAVVLATVFWTWVWGIPGLLLAIPMTLCLAVVGRYVPGFGIFHVLLGDEPVLDAAERAYARLIAFDATGAARVVAARRAEVGAAQADDAVLLGALRRAERDRREGQVDEERYLAICDGVREALEGLDEPRPSVPARGAVLCLPAFAESDRVACEVLAHHLEASGITATIGPNATTTSEAVARAAAGGASAVCVVALPPFAALRVRYGIRRARSQAAGTRLIGVVLDPDADRSRILASLRQAGADEAAFTLADTLAALLPRASPVDVPSRLDGAERAHAPTVAASAGRAAE